MNQGFGNPSANDDSFLNQEYSIEGESKMPGERKQLFNGGAISISDQVRKAGGRVVGELTEESEVSSS